MDRLEVIEARMAELEAQAAALRAIPDPAEYEDETVISFEKSYSDGSGKWYVYVAVKKDGQWFITGQVTTHRYTDDELRVKLAQDSVRNIFRASSWEAVAKVVSTDSAPVTE